MPYKVYYSFLHDNEIPYEADFYRVYRQEVVGGVGGVYAQVAQINPTGLGKNIITTGVDLVDDCNVQYNYKVSAYNANAEIFCINPLFSGVEFPCPTASVTPTATTSVSVTPTTTTSASVTPTVTPTITTSISVTPTITPSISITPTITPSITATPSITPTPLVSIQFDGGLYTLCSPDDAIVTWNGTHNIQEVTEVGYTGYSSSEHIGSPIHDFQNNGDVETITGLGANAGETRYFVCTLHSNSKFRTTC